MLHFNCRSYLQLNNNNIQMGNVRFISSIRFRFESVINYVNYGEKNCCAKQIYKVVFFPIIVNFVVNFLNVFLFFSLSGFNTSQFIRYT